MQPQPRLTPLTHLRRIEWVSALLALIVAIAALIIGSDFGKLHNSADLHQRVVAWSSAAVVLVFGVLATRRIASGVGRLISARAMPAAGAAVRLTLSGTGYVIVIFAELGLLGVSIEHLLVGAGVAGVVLGIAAQQSLGNVFASIVLLMAQPFVVGDHIRIRSGAMGGIFDGVVLGISLTYVTLRTDDGILRIPNSVMLATAVGPMAKTDPPVKGP